MLLVESAKYISDYRILVTFNNGVAGVADLSPVLWGPMFEPLKKLEEFRRFHVSDELSTVVWPNGADVAPERLLELVRMQEENRQAA